MSEKSEKGFAEKLGCEETDYGDFRYSFDDGVGNLYIPADFGSDIGERLGRVLASKRIWQSTFPEKSIVAMTSIYRYVDAESILDGVLYHYEFKS